MPSDTSASSEGHTTNAPAARSTVASLIRAWRSRPGFFFQQLLTLAAVALLPLVGLHTYTLWSQREAAEQHAYESMRSLVREVALRTDSSLARAEALLSYLDKSTVDPGQPQNCSAVLVGLTALEPMYDNIGLADAEGNRLCEADSRATAPNFRKRRWWGPAINAKSHHLGTAFDSEFLKKPLAMMSHPNRDKTGGSMGVFVIALDVAQLAKNVLPSNLPKGAQLAIVDANGKLFAQVSDTMGWAGTPANEVMLRLRASSTDVLRGTAADGGDSLAAKATIARYGLTAIMILPATAVFNESNLALRRSLAGALLTTGLCLLAAVFGARRLAQPVKALTRLSRNIAEGNRTERVNTELPGEFGLMGQEFNRMLDEQARAEQRLEDKKVRAQRLSSLNGALTATNQSLVRLESPAQLHRRVCEAMLACLNIKAIWVTVVTFEGQEVLAVEDRSRGLANLLKSYGLDRMALTSESELPWVVNDLKAESRTADFAVAASQHGIAGAAALPLTHNGAFAGFVHVLTDVPDYFEPPVVEILQRLAGDVSLGLDNYSREQKRLQALENLHQHEQRLAGIIESVADVIITLDAEHRIVVFNKAASRMFGVSAETVVGHPFELFIPPRQRLQHRRVMQELNQCMPGSDTTAKLMTLRANDTEFTVEAKISCQRSSEDSLLTLVMRDVTKERQAELERQARAEAEAASKAKTEFLSRMSHELRTPLNAILGFSRLVQESAQERLSEEEYWQLGHAVEAGNQLRALIDDVLDVSRIEAGVLALDIQTCSLQSQLDKALKLVQAEAERQEVSLTGTYADLGPCHINTDPVRLQQVLLNLLSNAIKYNRKGGSVELAVESGVEHLKLMVRDTGIGMSAEQQAQLFQPFNRLGRERGDIEGTGIGLMLTRQLVELLGGELRVYSQEGSGTEVTVVLPPAQGGATQPQATFKAATAEVTTPGGDVLYIEDNPTNVALVRQLLRRLPGVTLSVATTGESGLELAQKLQPKLILLDMRLPDMAGMDVLQTLKATASTREIPVVSLSASAMAAEVEAAKAAGAADYWTKPVDFATFYEGLPRFLPHARMVAPHRLSVTAS